MHLPSAADGAAAVEAGYVADPFVRPCMHFEYGVGEPEYRCRLSSDWRHVAELAGWFVALSVLRVVVTSQALPWLAGAFGMRRPSEGRTGGKGGGGGGAWSGSAERLAKLRSKFGESGWYFLFYSCAMTFNMWSHGGRDSWLWVPASYWGDNIPCEFLHPIRTTYLCELAFYASAMVFLLFDHRKSYSDRVMMTVHHVVTVLLIGFSARKGHLRIGVAIMMVHDVSDVFLESAKLINYVVEARGQTQQAVSWWRDLDTWKNVDFVFFAVAFFVTRMVLYPRVVHSAAFDTWIYSTCASGYWILVPSLWILQVLHVIWFGMVARMIVRALREGNVEEDIREESENKGKDD